MEAAQGTTSRSLKVSSIDEKTTIHSLPYELMLKIFENLDLKSIAHSIKTCKTWKQIVETNHLFKSIFFKLLPDTAKNLKGDAEEAFFLRNLIWDARLRSEKIYPTLIEIDPIQIVSHFHKGLTSCFQYHEGKVYGGTLKGKISIWDAKKGEKLNDLEGVYFSIGEIKISCGKIIGVSNDNAFHIWDLNTEKELKVIKGNDNSILSFEVSEGKIVSASNIGVRIIDIETGNETLAINFLEPVSERLIYQGKIFILSKDAIHIFEVLKGEELGVLKDPEQPITHFQAAHGKIFSISNDNLIRIWDIETKKKLLELSGHTDSITDLKIYNKKLFSSSRDGTIRIWDIEIAKEIRKFEGHTGPVIHIGLDDKKLITTSWDQTIRVWDIESGKELRKVTHLSLPLKIFIADGKVFMGTFETSIKIWDFTQNPKNPIH